MHLSNTITSVVVGSDESKWGLKALDIAAEFAHQWDAKLTVLSAVPSFGGMGMFASSGGAGGTEAESIMESYLEDLNVRIAPIQERYPDLKIAKSVVPGSAVTALTDASHNSDVVVVGSRGRGGFTGLILGSTSQGLLQHAASPVYVVPRKYVEAAESRMDTVPASPADVEPKNLGDITGVQEVSVPTAERQVAQDIDATIDPEFKAR